MKFIHLSDICIGNGSEAGMRWEEARIGEITESLKALMLYAENEKADLVVITGGLFSHIPVSSELKEVSEVFMAHKNIRVVISAGTSDKVTGSSPVKSWQWPDNVSYILEKGVQKVELPDIKTEIFAGSAVSEVRCADDTGEADASGPAIKPFRDMPEDTADESGVSELKETVIIPGAAEYTAAAAQAVASEAIRIAMLPGRPDEKDLREFKSSDFSYVAAGGKAENKEHELIKDMAYCPGSFEPEDTSDTGAHGAMAGTISEETGRLSSISFVPLASASYVTLNIKINNKTTAEELTESVRKEFVKRGEKNIYRLRITGERKPELDIDFEGLKSAFRIREITDETEPWYDFAELFKEHPQDMIGFYISNIAGRKKEMSKTEKRAMFYGIDALLKTASDEENA